MYNSVAISVLLEYAGLLSDSFLVRFPSLLPVFIGTRLDILLSLDLVNTPSNDNDIAFTVLDDLGRRSVLLTHSVALLLEVDPRSQSQEIFVFFTHPLHGDETEYELGVFSCHLDDGLGILPSSEITS